MKMRFQPYGIGLAEVRIAEEKEIVAVARLAPLYGSGDDCLLN